MANHVWRFIFITGVCVVIMCFLIQIGAGKEWMGKLPGDILITKGQLRIYFPIGPAAIIGAALTLIMGLLGLLRK